MRTWRFLNNTFINVTQNSYRQCKKIADYTLAALQQAIAQAPFDALHADLAPLVSNYNTLYAHWKSQLGFQKGKTSQLNKDLAHLQSEKIRQWDVLIQMQYSQGSAEYVALLPKRRKPFQLGSQEDRIAAVAALSKSLANMAPLAAVKAEVDDFLSRLQANFTVQKGEKSTTQTDSAALENARIAVCVQLYATLGTLMVHFKTKPEDAGAFFDLQSIRHNEQSNFTHNLSGGETRLALTHTFDKEEEIRLINKGNTPLRFALCPQAKHPITSPYIDLAANDERIVLVDQLGANSSRFLKVQNLHKTEEGRYIIALL